MDAEIRRPMTTASPAATTRNVRPTLTTAISERRNDAFTRSAGIPIATVHSVIGERLNAAKTVTPSSVRPWCQPSRPRLDCSARSALIGVSTRCTASRVRATISFWRSKTVAVHVSENCWRPRTERSRCWKSMYAPSACRTRPPDVTGTAIRTT